MTGGGRRAAKVAVAAVALPALCVGLIHAWLLHKSYLLDDQALARIAEKHVGESGRVCGGVRPAGPPSDH